MTHAPRTLVPGSLVDGWLVVDALPTAYLVMTPDLRILHANPAYLAMLGRRLADIAGRPVFEAFPPSPLTLAPDGTNPLETSFRRALGTGRPDALPLQQYDVRDDSTGEVVERFWSVVTAPVADAEGRTVLLVERVEDVTDFVREREGLLAGADRGQGWQDRAQRVEAELFLRAQELQAAQAARDLAARRVASLAEVALALTTAESIDDLERIVVGRAPAVLGSDGGAVVTVAEGGGWRLSISEVLGPHVQVAYGHLPHDSPLPAVHAARTGERVLLPTVGSGLAFLPLMATVYADTRRRAWAFVPLTVQDEHLGSLAVSWRDEHAFTDDELDLLDGFAAQLAQTLKRLQVAAAQRAAAAAVQEFSEALQRSLLTRPALGDDLDVAVRYRPAARGASVGGDWYDAFVTAGGATLFAVGDITGHDRAAAAAMGQVRSLLRGIAYDSDDPPADLLNRLDAAMVGLELDALATAVVARLEVGERDGVTRRCLRWANAGHPPPLLARPDGSVEVLQGTPDLLLGHDPQASRRDHLVALAPGCSVVLYTDGLVERRDEDLDVGIARLVAVVARHAGDSAEDLSDAVLAETDSVDGEDDTAVLVLRLR
ncbi:SpoIIE family protein phosphatase [Kineococcus rubinsiae]|uniref:SpoIIE family protein phosphatase n=1 Tax=Kineococcus rubinsiae TaxID=2609562 RepID=UPI001431FD32|nr:SpoIIE family protein phosphatase [Kineococcus rubinsiae]